MILILKYGINKRFDLFWGTMMAHIQLSNGIVKIGDIVNRIDYYTKEVDYSVCFRVTGFQTYEGELQPTVIMLNSETMQPYIRQDGELSRTSWLIPSKF